MGLRKREYIHEETLITAENLNEIQDAVIALEDGLFSVDNTVSGEEITITDAYKRGFRSFSIYGKTTQDGTPTPDNPVDLENIGDSGSITVNVSGKNDKQSMTIATPNGLPGVPVSTGGNYTDANGQQWICDEIDFARGVYVQRVNVVGFENAKGTREAYPVGGNIYRFAFWPYDNPMYLPCTMQVGLCNALAYSPAPSSGNYANNSICGYSTGGIFVRCDTFETISDFIAWAKSVALKVQYPLATPIETPLSEEELAAYASLHTYRDSTTVSNDAGAYMELEYVMDSKKYIDSKLSSAIHTATVE